MIKKKKKIECESYFNGVYWFYNKIWKNKLLKYEVHLLNIINLKWNIYCGRIKNEKKMWHLISGSYNYD